MDISKLIPGDILLYSGSDTLSNFINCFDNSHYSHAAIYIGNGMIQESNREGCLRKPLKLSFSTYEEILVKRIENRCELGKLKRVLKHARKLEGKEYDFIQIIQLAHFGFSNCPPITYADGLNLLGVLDYGINILAGRILNSDDKLQCAEFAYRCYNDAVKNEDERNDMYSIELLNDNILEGEAKIYNQFDLLSEYRFDYQFKEVKPADRANDTLHQARAEEYQYISTDEVIVSKKEVIIDAIDKINFEEIEKENLQIDIQIQKDNIDTFFKKVESYTEEKLTKNVNQSSLISSDLKEKIEGKLYEFRILAGAALVNNPQIKSLKMTYNEKTSYYSNIAYRSKFVTAKDLNQAKNLVNVMKFKPDINKAIEELDLLEFDKNDYPTDKIPCKKEDIKNKNNRK